MVKTGTCIDKRYEVLDILGQGGMGKVYKVVHTHLNTVHALKELINHQFGATDQFQVEAQILAQLNHFQLPKVTDYFHHKKKYYLVMDFIDGDDLDSLMNQQIETLSAQVIIRWGIQLLNVLQYIHNKGIVHRDIKPANIKLTPQNQIVLVDFGIAKQTAVQIETVMSAKGAFTPYLAAPEQIQGQHTDQRTDIYAVGTTMAYLLTQQLPIPKNICEFNLSVSQELESILKRATALLPSVRFQNASEMREHLLLLSSHSEKNLRTTGFRRDLRKR